MLEYQGVDNVELDHFIEEHSDLSSQFEFEAPFLMDIQETLYQNDQFEKILGPWGGIAIIVGVCVGSGIFTSPGLILSQSGSVAASLIVWFCSGILSLMGALCYCELGTAYPNSGGEHQYLYRAYGSLVAFLYSWTALLLAKPISICIITITFGEYLSRFFKAEVTLLSATLMIMILTASNISSVKLTTALQNYSTLLKLMAVAFIGLFGFFSATRSGILFENNLFQGSSNSFGNYSLSIYFGLWAYDGWNNLNLITEEVHNPNSNLPTAITFGLVIVIISYQIINLTYFAVLPKILIADSITVAFDFALHVFGKYGPSVILLIVFICTIGAANATIFTSSRLFVVSGRHDHFPSILSRISDRTNTPIIALLFQMVLALLYLQIGHIRSLLVIYSISTWIFYLITVMGLIVLRVTDPFANRPFKVWIIIPMIFNLCSFLVIVLSIYHNPMAGIVCGAVLLTGCIAFTISKFCKTNLDQYSRF